MAFGISGSDNIEIRIQVDNTGAVKLLSDTEKQIGKVGEATKKASKESDEFFNSFVKGAGQALGAYVSFTSAINAIKFGSQVADIESAFKRLTSEIGVSASELQGRFTEALGGTLSAFETTRKANELLVAGIDPSKFDELAQVSRALADTLGTDTKQALDQVSEALIRGNDRALKSLGITIDQKKAADDFARSIGTTADKLNQAGIIEANRIAIMAKAEEQLKRLGGVENDAADNLERLSANLANMRAEVAKAIQENPELNRLLKELSEIDFTRLIGDFQGLVSIMAESGRVAKDALGWLLDAEALRDGGKVIANLANGAGLGTAINMAAVEKYAESIKKVSAGESALIGIVEKKENTIKKATKTISGYIDTNAGTAKELEKQIDAIFKVEGGYKKLLEAVSKGIITQDRFTKEVEDLKKEALKSKLPIEELAKVIDSVLGAALEENKKKTESVEEGFASLKQAAIDAAEQMANAAPVFSKVFDALGAGNSEMAISIAGSMEVALAEGISLALSGAGTSEDYRATATQLGGEIGTAIGGPVIGAFAEQLTNDIVNIGKSSRDTFKGAFSAMFGPVGGAIADGLFGSSFEDSAGTALKKSLDKILTDVGYDFTFSGNQDLTKGLFAGLGQQAQEQFTIAGDALTTFLGGSTDLGVNLGAVLANNNVHLSELADIITSVGGSFESLSLEMLNAFYEGEIGIIALQDQLEELYGIMEGSSTFEDLGAAAQAALNSDGRVLLNSIKAIGVEAQQLGAVTLPQMADILVNRFGMAASQVQMIMSSMTAAGINSVAQLAEATKLTSTAIAANIGMAQQGLTPNNTPVISLATEKPKTDGGSRSGGQSAAEKAKREREQKEAKAKQELLRLLSQVQNSAKGRELDQAVASGVLTDGAYADQIQSLTKEAQAAQKKLDEAESAYAKSAKKGAEQQQKALKDLLSAQKSLETVLGGSGKGFDVNSGFMSFAEKFAGNVQLIEKAAEAAGLKFDDMREKALKAFLSGDKSFTEARKMLQDSGKGVAGKDGAVGEVLSRLLSRGENGGIFSIDDLKGLASEARELGAETLDGLFEGLSGQGASQKDQQALSIALQNAGITALDQLENISTDVAINVLDIMKQSGAQFSQTSQDLRDIAKQISEIPTAKKVTIELGAYISPEVQATLDKVGLLPEGFKNGSVSAGTTWSDSALGIRNKKQNKYNMLLKAGRKADAKKFKQNNAQYF
jgi:hypothetical protein